MPSEGASDDSSVLDRFRGGDYAAESTNQETSSLSDTTKGEPATIAVNAVAPEEVETADKTLTEKAADALVSLLEIFESDGDGPSTIDRFAYQKFSGWFRERGDRPRYRKFRQTINQARHDETYDQYLARMAFWSLVVGGLGALFGLSVGLALELVGVFDAINTSWRFPPEVARFIEPVWFLRIPLAIILIGVFNGVLFGGTTAGLFYALPKFNAYNRAREIKHLLPQTVTYMYALSQGDMTFPDIVHRIADEEDTYGEVAIGYQAVVNDMAFFGADLRTALREAREATPSREFGELLDDMVGIIDSGTGQLSPFLKDKTEQYQRRAHKQAENMLNSMAFVAEFYITLGVVGVLLGFTVFIIMTTITGSGLGKVYALIYIGVPTIGAGFLVILDSITADNMSTKSTLPERTNRTTVEDVEQHLAGKQPSISRPDPQHRRSGETDFDQGGRLSPIERARLKQLHTALRRQRVLEMVRAPVRIIQEKPLYSLGVTIPLALVYNVFVVLSGIAVPTPSNFINTPVWTTAVTIVLPLLGILTPISYFHEKNVRYQNRVNKELPDVLKKLAAASEGGADLQDAIGLVAESSDDYLADELMHVRNELRWNTSLEDALVRMANRVENPRLTRVLKLLIEANTASGRVREVLTVAANDTQNAYEIDKDRFAEMTSYMGITLFGYVLYLVISIILMIKLFPPLAEAAQASTGMGAGAANPFGGNINISEYRMILYHGALLQSASSGLVAAKVSYDDVLRGVKFVIAGISVSTLAFFLI